MKKELITGAVWNKLRSAARANRSPSWVAVAYFGQGADRLLRLARGSRLVVDCSLSAVKAGQTHPATLMKLVRRGVRVYSIENLHAKVFVFGHVAYIGSANVSQSSALRLVEAMLCTSDPAVVNGTRSFVRQLCREELSPKALGTLQKSYRPPKFEVAQSDLSRRPKAERAETSPFRLVQLKLIEWPEGEIKVQEEGLRAAKSRREHRNGWAIQSFRLTGRCRIARNDLVMQVIDEGAQRTFIEPPGKVLNVVRRKTRRAQVAYVYIEVRTIRRRPSIEMLARSIGRGVRKRLLRDGLVRDADLAQKLQLYWTLRTGAL